jgi:hypothetical protein
MTMYRVDLVQTVIEEATVYVEASSTDAAVDMAMKKSLYDGDVKWHFADSQTDPEVLTVTPVQRADLQERWNKGAADITELADLR